jgi:hypothetical protein
MHLPEESNNHNRLDSLTHYTYKSFLMSMPCSKKLKIFTLFILNETNINIKSTSSLYYNKIRFKLYYYSVVWISFMEQNDFFNALSTNYSQNKTMCKDYSHNLSKLWISVEKTLHYSALFDIIFVF